MDAHVSSAHGDEEGGGGGSGGLACPLCEAFRAPERPALERHLAGEHNVPEEGVQRLLALLPAAPATASAPPQAHKCPVMLPSPPCPVPVEKEQRCVRCAR